MAPRGAPTVTYKVLAPAGAATGGRRWHVAATAVGRAGHRPAGVGHTAPSPPFSPFCFFFFLLPDWGGTHFLSPTGAGRAFPPRRGPSTSWRCRRPQWPHGDVRPHRWWARPRRRRLVSSAALSPLEGSSRLAATQERHAVCARAATGAAAGALDSSCPPPPLFSCSAHLGAAPAAAVPASCCFQ